MRQEYPIKHVIKLCGGLGNQMFQYAFGQALHISCAVSVVYDSCWFETMWGMGWSGATERKYGLNAFKCSICFATQSQISACCPEYTVRHSRLPGEIRKWFNIPKYKTISNKIFEKQENIYDESLLEPRNIGYYEGYYQTEQYFSDLRDQLLIDFTLDVSLDDPNKRMLDRIKAVNGVSLHVRRGDYVALAEVYDVCSLIYYQKAIEYMVEHLSEPYFFIFSDDIAWVKEHLNLEQPHVFVDINDEKTCHFDLELMKNCKHHIIANSSFSWWGAWLNVSPTKIVVAPNPWFADGRATNIVCKGWIQIEG